MNMLATLAASGNSDKKTYVDDVFAITLFEGQSSAAVALNIQTGLNINPEADPYFSSVKFLCSFNGANINKANGSVESTNFASSTAGGIFGAYLRSSRSSAGSNSTVSNSAAYIAPSDYNLPWCIEGWFMTAGVTDGNNSSVRIFDTQGSGSSYVYMTARNTGSNTDTCLNVLVSDGGSFPMNVSISSLTLGAWHFARLDYDGTSLNLYVDGILRSSSPFTGFTTLPVGGYPNIGTMVANDVSGATSCGISEVRWTFGNARTAARTTVPNKRFPATGVAGSKGFMMARSRISSAMMIHDAVRTTNVGLIDVSSTNAVGSAQEQNFAGFHSNGFYVGGSANLATLNDQIAYTFKAAKKFVDVVEYDGNSTIRDIPHGLGATPAMIWIVCTSNTGSHRYVWHKNFAAGDYTTLNSSPVPVSDSTLFNTAAHTDTTFKLGSSSLVNQTGLKYAAYLFADDPSADGVIRCGAVGGGTTIADLGWEPSFVMVINMTAAFDRFIIDSERGNQNGDNDRMLTVGSTSAESLGNYVNFHPNGVSIDGLGGNTLAYMAIRRFNKPPTSGTKVFNAITRTGTGGAATVTGVGFSPDAVWVRNRATQQGGQLSTKLTGTNSYLRTDGAGDAESQAYTDGLIEIRRDGFKLGTDLTSGALCNTGSLQYVYWLFRRAAGVLDMCRYKGDNVSPRNIKHNLGTIPEMIWVKNRTTASTGFAVYHKALGAGGNAYLNSNGAPTLSGSTLWNATDPTSSQFTVNAFLNTINDEFIVYSWATLAGVSMVGSYIGNGGTKNIDCGFANGTRFALIRRKDNSGSWYLFDSIRGITAGADPFLLFDSIAAEDSTDVLDPYAAGFTVNQLSASNLNVNNAEYIFLAIA